MAATATAGSGKVLVVQQTVAEAAVYTIAASDVFVAGFSIDEIIVDTQVGNLNATLAVANNGNNALAGAFVTVDTPGIAVAALTATTANLIVAAGTNLVLTTTGISQNRITLVVSEIASRSVPVT